MITGIHHLALAVSDMAATARYYEAAAGMVVRSAGDATAIAAPLGAIDDGIVPEERRLLAGRNGHLLLLGSTSPPAQDPANSNPINRAGIRHFCAQNADCTRLERAVFGHGGSLIAAPLDLGTGNQYAYARDPEGNIMEIEGLPYAPADEPTWLGHVAIVTRDMDRAIEFYGTLLGAPLRNRGRFGPGPQFDRMGGLVDARIEGAWLDAGNMLIELWQFHAPSSPVDARRRAMLDPGFSYLCFESNDIDGDIARLTALGGQRLTDAINGDHGRIAFATDPEGNVLALLAPHPALAIATLPDPGVYVRVEAGR